jgi:transposase InsO family protein
MEPGTDRSYQQADGDLQYLYKKKKEGLEDRPDKNELSPLSPVAKAYFSEWRRIELWKGVLYRRWENDAGTETRMQLIVPAALQRSICQDVHDGSRATHMGKKKTMRLLLKNFHWYRMDHDVGWWIRTCDVCQRRKRPVRPPRAPMKIWLSGHPNETVSMDIVGPLKESESGNKYVLCITDHFSRYARAYAIPDQSAQTVAAIFVNHWICEDGEPHVIHTDQGANFESELMAQVCELHQVGKTRTTPYHPQGNAVTERFNQTIIDIVSKLVDRETYANWDSVLPKAVAAYNSTEHRMTRHTPHRLFKNREMVHNLDKMLPWDEQNGVPETYDEYVLRMDAETREAFEIAREVMGKAALVTKKYYDKHANLITHKIGDTIMLRTLVRAEKRN